MLPKHMPGMFNVWIIQSIETSLDDTDSDARILRQSVREHESGGTSATNDEVVLMLDEFTKRIQLLEQSYLPRLYSILGIAATGGVRE